MTCRTCLRRLAAIQELALPRHTMSAQRSLRAFSTQPFSSIESSGSSRSMPGHQPPSPLSKAQQGQVQARTYTSIVRNASRPAPATSRHASRFFSTSPRRSSAAATLAEEAQDMLMPSAKPPIKVTPPSLDAIKEEGYLDDDVQLIDPEDAWINITPDAVKQLEKITAREPPEILEKGLLALRVGVESGGCHGYQYTMEIVEERGVDDYIMQPEGVNCIPVVIDLVSLGLLKGATLHHATELIGSSFRLQDNPQAKQGGNCGCGISWELK